MRTLRLTTFDVRMASVMKLTTTPTTKFHWQMLYHTDNAVIFQRVSGKYFVCLLTRNVLALHDVVVQRPAEVLVVVAVTPQTEACQRAALLTHNLQ